MWTGSEETAPNHHGITLQTPESTSTYTPQHPLTYYLKIYIVLSTLTALLATTSYLYTATLSLKASRRLFASLTAAVLRAPLGWHDATPTGRILNRFTADFDAVDTRLAKNMMLTADSALGAMGICGAAVLGTRALFVPAAVLLFVCARLGKSYLAVGRPARRLESNARSPMFELYTA
ncbi:hypothetical protein IMZ48_39000, partial [Candidatus Bathyarchaeota archaeon]|nr:hypothetical protein [Candidatus Bathyarchaeota archaeon]